MVCLVAKKTKTLHCHHHSQIPMGVMEVTALRPMLLINIQVPSKASMVTRSMDKAINISIRIGSIPKVDMAVTISGVDMAEDIAISFFSVCVFRFLEFSFLDNFCMF